ncbi:MAG: helix-turn-helix transcriptional regulator [Candidatus Ventricola sp.]
MKNRLEALRREKGIRQEDLAQALDVSRQTIISLEKGKYNPSLALAFKLARYFALPIEEIFDDSDERV